MKASIDFNKVIEAVKKTKRKICLGLLAVIIVVVGLFLLAGKTARPSPGEAVFYYKGEGANSKLFYLSDSREPEYLITLPSEEVDLEKYKVHQHSYVSHNGEILIYFEKVDEIPIEDVGEGFTAYRKMYKPKYVDLRTGSVKNIKPKIDSGSVVFSPDDKDIAWVLRVEESTVDELEQTGKKREIWLSDPNGDSGRRLAALEDKVALIQRWQGNYLYFWGLQGVGYYSLGKIDVRTGQIKYAQPKYCLEDLTNCQNFIFSPSGELFIYEAGLIKDNEKTIELFVESLDQEKSWQILVDNYISDRLWMPDEENIVYTEQVTEKKVGLREKIHLVNLKTGEDSEIYSGNYLSQITPDKSGKYLYFLEKETDEKFNLTRLNIKTGETEIIDSGAYDQLKIFSGM